MLRICDNTLSIMGYKTIGQFRYKKHKIYQCADGIINKYIWLIYDTPFICSPTRANVSLDIIQSNYKKLIHDETQFCINIILGSNQLAHILCDDVCNLIKEHTMIYINNIKIFRGYYLSDYLR